MTTKEFAEKLNQETVEKSRARMLLRPFFSPA